MPIVGRTPEECIETFRDHVARLVSKTLTRRYPVLVVSKAPKMVLSLVDGNAPVPLQTKLGRVFFYLGQALEAVHQDDGTYRLQTLQYWYRLQGTPDPQAHALLRWEYTRPDDVRVPGPPRHHAHVRTKVALDGSSLDLDKVHLPTGWVTMEEVIRFLIHELGVKPPCGTRWAEELSASEAAFYDKFTGKRYVPPKKRPT